MTKITADPDLRNKLQGFQDLVEICDESGHVVGFFHPAARSDSFQEHTQSPISDADIEFARAQRTGRPLTDIFADLDRGA